MPRGRRIALFPAAVFLQLEGDFRIQSIARDLAVLDRCRHFL
jgi:hypothetical protein